MALVWRDVIELKVAAMVGSTARAYHANVPTTSWMCLIRSVETHGEASGLVRWTFAPC